MRERTFPLHHLEIDITLFDIRVDQLDSEPMAHIYTLTCLDQPTFDRGLKNSDPRSFVGGTRTDRLKMISDPGSKQHRRSGLGDQPFHLVGEGDKNRSGERN